MIVPSNSEYLQTFLATHKIDERLAPEQVDAMYRGRPVQYRGEWLRLSPKTEH